jgi:predicted lipoprotein
MVRTAGSLAAFLLLGGCGDAFVRGEKAQEPVPEEVKTMLQSVGPEVVVPALDRFATAAEELDSAAASWDGGDDREALQEAWRAAMTAWQECEMYQLGPAASTQSADKGSSDLRDNVYSWPTVYPCAVDQQTLMGPWSPGYFEVALVNGRGLDAIEHLVFTEGTGNACPSQALINSDGTWDALGDDGVRAARAAFVQALSEDLLRTATSLSDAWGPFVDYIGEPGSSGSPYVTGDDALTAVFHAMFYVETGVKDRKLAIPLGLRDCGQEQCPGNAEHLSSGLSTLAIGQNLAGFRLLFTGGDGVGMDDLLVDLGHGDLADAMLQATEAAEAAVPLVDMPINQALTGDLEDLQALHSAVGGITDLLKNDFTTVLSLQVPAEAGDDND